MAGPRKVPRPFSLHWGSGQVSEEVSYLSEHKEAVIQLLDYTEGEVAGGWAVRFCHYSPGGGFRRDPLIVDEADIRGLREALRQSPRLMAILRQLVGDA
jgi:hypothetical protein